MPLVRDVMTTDVLSFRPDQSVREAAAALAARHVDGAPVVDASGAVVGMLSTGDLIVQDSQLHLPTTIAIFGALIELPWERRRFDDEVHKALASTVEELMERDPVTIAPDVEVQEAASVMHTRDVSRLPVVQDGTLVGIIARADVLRAFAQGR
jgi:CBS domain-containing protein